LANLLSTKTIPYTGDPFMFDYSEGPTGIYSENRAKTIAWHRYYTRFWKQSIGYCDWVWPYWLNTNNPDMASASPEGEPRFFNAVTGNNWSFADGIEAGRKVWNLHNAIWTLQGRHRNMLNFSGYVYNKPTDAPYLLPVYENGEWSYSECLGRVLNKTKWEEFKTRFYTRVGWDTNSGWPTRTTLEGLGLGNVADALQSAGKLGS
jgi:aldehyde:ferredoxin oxidoreductase